LCTKPFWPGAAWRTAVRFRPGSARPGGVRAGSVGLAAMTAEQPEEKKEGEGEQEADEKKELEPEEKKELEPEDEEAKIDFEGLDLFGVDEVNDVGAGMPLFREFQVEDWTVMGLAFELHLMAHAFGKDVDDPDRKGMHLDHLQFYYQKYYRKPLNLQIFGVSSVKDLLALGMLRDVIYATKEGVLQSALDEEMESFQIFVKLAEEARRYRTVRADFGDESEALKLQVGGNQQWAGYQAGQQQQRAAQQPWAAQQQWAGQQQEGETVDITVEQAKVGWLLGKAWVVLKTIEAQSGARCALDQSTKGLGYSTVRISGSSDCSARAKQMIEEKLSQANWQGQQQGKGTWQQQGQPWQPGYGKSQGKAATFRPCGGCGGKGGPYATLAA